MWLVETMSSGRESSALRTVKGEHPGASSMDELFLRHPKRPGVSRLQQAAEPHALQDIRILCPMLHTGGGSSPLHLLRRAALYPYSPPPPNTTPYQQRTCRSSHHLHLLFVRRPDRDCFRCSLPASAVLTVPATGSNSFTSLRAPVVLFNTRQLRRSSADGLRGGDSGLLSSIIFFPSLAKGKR